MLNRRKIFGVALTLVVLGAAGYFRLNPSLASTCRAAYDTSAVRVRQQVDAAGASFKRTEFYASVVKEMRALELREQLRKRAAAASAATPPQTAGASQTQLSAPPPAAARQPELSRGSPGQRIAHGHAFAKHGGDLGFATAGQLAEHVDRVTGTSRFSNVRRLSRGRTAYWDDDTDSVVIVDPNTADGGTAFKPRRGRAYFESLK